MPYLSSLPARVDIEDWLDEDLPALVAHLMATVPDRLGILGLPASYPSVAGNDALDDLADGRLLALVTHDDEFLHELVGDAEISGTIARISHLIEQSESMNFPVRGF